MRQPNLAAPIITILPALALIPVISSVLAGAHNGGLNILYRFLSASIQPSLEPIVLQSAWRGIQITIATALLGWVISTLIGTILGLLSSNIFWQVFELSQWKGSLLRKLLAIPRSIHELIWGLLLLQLFGISQWVAIIAICIPYSCLVARVLSDQIDSLDHRALIALQQSGASPFSALITTLVPSMIPVINSYGGYQLECALRGATILGVFGLGGVGTELQLTLQSLEFREMWTSLWMLGVVMISFETFLNWYRQYPPLTNKYEKQLLVFIGAILTTIIISILWLKILDVNLVSTFKWHPSPLPTIVEMKEAFHELPLITLIGTTILLTILAAGFSIGLPPLGMMLWPTKTGAIIQSSIWSLLRLIPPPLSALLLLLCTNPNISVAALALGLQNLGVMGRLLKEGISHQSNNLYIAIHSSGSNNRLAWLYGHLSPYSSSYLAYAAYRTDVLLRETAVVGVVGGVGLGWQLQESISSFNWPQVIWITTAYSILTLIGESLSRKVRQYWIKSTTKDPQILFFQK